MARAKTKNIYYYIYLSDIINTHSQSTFKKAFNKDNNITLMPDNQEIYFILSTQLCLEQIKSKCNKISNEIA